MKTHQRLPICLFLCAISGAPCGDAAGTGGGGSEAATTATGEGGHATCIGGVVVDGQCEGKCTPDLCLPGNTCVGNECVLLCDAHHDCLPDGTQSCVAAVEDDTNAPITICQANGAAPGLGEHCPLGTECAAPYECITHGEGDATAYCTEQDCSTDADCIGGYYCGITRDPHRICDSEFQKGDNSLCGYSEEPCIALSDLGNGNALFEGSACVLRRTCLKRESCAPCELDVDCSQVDGQRCAMLNGEKRCLSTCAQSSDCDPDYECNAEGVCAPRYGACVGSGGFCEPCVNDEDCGDATTTMACIREGGASSGVCLDVAFPDSCAVPEDCPMSPSGDYGACYIGTCVLPYDPVSNRFGCWL